MFGDTLHFLLSISNNMLEILILLHLKILNNDLKNYFNNTNSYLTIFVLFLYRFVLVKAQFENMISNS